MSSVAPAAAADRRAERRAVRRAENRTEILDAAERVFGEHGVRDGSLREIAALSGFSTAAIYLFFDNKQHLLSETLTRRGAELVGTLQAVADTAAAPIAKLHRIVDATVAFFEARPDFRRMLRYMSGGAPIVGPALGTYPTQGESDFTKAMAIIAGIVGDGQHRGEIRAGNADAIAHLYSVLVNEHVLLAAGAESGVEALAGTLSTEEFHALIDGALRNPLH